MALTNDRHALAVAVEVQQGQHLVGVFRAQLADSDGVLGARQEDKAKVSGSGHEGAFIRRGRLIDQLT